MPLRASHAGLILLVLACVPLGSACGELLCTLVGCGPSFVVTLEGNVPNEYTITLEVTGELAVTYTSPADCPSCPDSFPWDGTPEEVEVVVVDAVGAEIGKKQANEPVRPATGLQADHRAQEGG